MCCSWEVWLARECQWEWDQQDQEQLWESKEYKQQELKWLHSQLAS